jgi:hypothetical protein
MSASAGRALGSNWRPAADGVTLRRRDARNGSRKRDAMALRQCNDLVPPTQKEVPEPAIGKPRSFNRHMVGP